MDSKLQKESEIIRKCKENKEAFQELYTLYYKDVYRFLFSLVKGKELAEDLLQETFITAYRKIGNFKWKGVSIKFWLLSIAHKKAFEQFSKKDKEIKMGDFVNKIKEADPVRMEYDVQLLEDIKDALDVLKPIEREIIVLKVWEEYTFSQIGELISEKESTIKMCFYRSIAKLQKILEERKYNKKLLAFPILFGGILRISKNQIFLPSKSLSNFSVSTAMDKFALFVLKNKLLVGGISLGTILVGAVAVPVTISQINNNRDQNQTTDSAETIDSQNENLNDADTTTTTTIETSAQNDESEATSTSIVTNTTSKPVQTTTTTTIPAPTEYQFMGNFVTATLPTGWTIEEVTSDNWGSTGFVGMVVRDGSGIELFRLSAAVAVGGGSSICDYQNYYAFPDDIPGRYDSLLNQKKTLCDPNATITKTDLPLTSNISFFENRFRRVGTSYYIDVDEGDSYFSTEGSYVPYIIGAGSLRWNGTESAYYYSFHNINGGNAGQMDQVLISVRAK